MSEYRVMSTKPVYVDKNSKGNTYSVEDAYTINGKPVALRCLGIRFGNGPVEEYSPEELKEIALGLVSVKEKLARDYANDDDPTDNVSVRFMNERQTRYIDPDFLIQKRRAIKFLGWKTIKAAGILYNFAPAVRDRWTGESEE